MLRTTLIMSLSLLLAVMPVVPAAAQETTSTASLDVSEMAFGSGYDRETRGLVGEASVFAAGTPTIYCRTRIVGADVPTSVTHVWYHDGATIAHVELPVGSSNWRTVSSKQMLPAWTGAWEVRVIDNAGNLLRSETFTIE